MYVLFNQRGAKKDLTPLYPFEKVLIPSGTFTMGCANNGWCIDDEQSVHEVTITVP